MVPETIVGQADVVVGEILVDGEQARLEDQDVVAGFDGQQIDAAGDQGLDLGVVAGHEIVEGEGSAVRRFVAWFDVQRLVGRPDAAGDEARPVRVAAREVVGGAAGESRRPCG